ncbi:hypothetical protein [[Mycoplasma] mobile]|uniref:Expressed protein n=1 Tax=Mycoplasma mobile (strain ATCC 43663 / 163K / NCTC 11711) TaxID=267748 RepID=Q6KHT0_MYCM1|nr:hypothetical protein [[Mycoplasma] mobile]AAT27848.1 expressed protein [Mycoplasma mobile 163K]
MKYNEQNFEDKLDFIYDLVLKNKTSELSKDEFKTRIKSIIERLKNKNIKFSQYWSGNLGFFLYKNSQKLDYENFSKNYTNKINKSAFDIFHSLNRNEKYLDLVNKKQFFELLEALEALSSFDLKIVELKKWSKWLTEIFDSEILLQYLKYISDPIMYFLVIIKDVLMPLKKMKQIEKNEFYNELTKNQKHFQKTFIHNETKYNLKLKSVQEYDKENLENLKLTKDDEDLKMSLDFAKKYNISFLRLFQFLSFPFFIEELDNIPQNIFLEHKDNIIVYSSKYYWGFELNASEFFYRLIQKHERIIPFVFLFMESRSKKMETEYIEFTKLLDFFLISESSNEPLAKIILLALEEKDKYDILLNDLKFVKNEELFAKIDKEIDSIKEALFEVN